MLTFSEDFFEAEERCGFLIDTTMKTVWAAELEVLCEIALVCERHNIPWYMAYGSLLGAVRHEGFIPWDDDMDICLIREDYQKLLEILPEELPEGYVVRSPLLENGYPEFHSCVANSDSISIEPEHLQKFHGCPFVVGVDIFPIDTLPKDGVVLENKKRAFQLIRKAVHVIKRERDVRVLEGISEILKRDYGIQLYSGKPFLPETDHEANEMAADFWRLANEVVVSSANEEMSNRACIFVDYVQGKSLYNTDWFRKIEELPFEDFAVPVPGQYDQVLRSTYGDYHIYKRQTAGHDYPFYTKQLEDLRRRVKEYEEEMY